MKNLNDIIIERLHITKDTKVNDNEFEEFGKGEWIDFYIDDILKKSNSRIKLIHGERHLLNIKIHPGSQVYFISDENLPRGGKLVNLLKKLPSYIIGNSFDQLQLYEQDNFYILAHIYFDENNKSIANTYISPK